MDILIALSLFIGGWLLIGMITAFIYKYASFKFGWNNKNKDTNSLSMNQVGFTLFGPLSAIVLFVALFIEFLYMFFNKMNK